MCSETRNFPKLYFCVVGDAVMKLSAACFFTLFKPARPGIVITFVSE